MNLDNLLAPSRMGPYNVKSVEVKPFNTADLMLLSRSAATNSIAPMIDAINNTVEGINARDLTVGDYYYLVAWQKFSTFPDSPPFASWDCEGILYLSPTGTSENEGERFYTQHQLNELRQTNDRLRAAGETPEFDEREMEVEQVTCGQHNNRALTFNNLTILRAPVDTELDPRLEFPRVSTLAEFIEMKAKPEYVHLAGPAQWVKEGRTLEDKLNVLLGQETTELFDLCSLACQDIVHGVSNFIKMPCTHCQTEALHSIDLSANSFFRTS
jgi:hypothetical protein